MAGIDRSTQRVIAVIALMIVAAWALRGYIPGGERVAEREKPPSNPAALVGRRGDAERSGGDHRVRDHRPDA